MVLEQKSVTLNRWKLEAVQNLSQLFVDDRKGITKMKQDYEQQIDELYGEVGRLTTQLFLLRELRREDGRLLARYRDGEAAFLGYVDDYAFLVWGLIELYETTFELRYLREAVQLNAEMLRLFGDEEKGGLFFYGSDAEQLLTRPKEIYDGAMPSGNGAAALNMLRLSRLTYDAKLSQAADEQLQAFAGAVSQYPPGHALTLAALDFAYGEASEIVIAGDPAKPETRAHAAHGAAAVLAECAADSSPAGSGR